LRRIYKKWNNHKDIISPDLLQLIRTSWSEYRSSYKKLKKEGGGGNDDDDDD